ncbi:MAG: Maf family protein [Gammaproteobacteria bacterium]|nr:Maf family protein [Gammaproteobacteria bacterium]
MKTKHLILASASPRRVQLLQQIQIEFKQQAADIDESCREGETAEAFVCRLAQEKARHICNKTNDKQAVVLGCDTIVVVDEHILGKPADYQDAVKMLTLLSARTHQVMTAVTLISEKASKTRLSISEVRFMPLSQHLIEAYWQTGEPQGKAGAYAIQGIAGQFIEKINGSYSAIMGLPLYETRRLLEEAGFELLGSTLHNK